MVDAPRFGGFPDGFSSSDSGCALLAGMPIAVTFYHTLYFNYSASCLIQVQEQSWYAVSLNRKQKRSWAVQHGFPVVFTKLSTPLPHPCHLKRLSCPCPFLPCSHLPESMLVMLLDALGGQLLATAQQVSVELQRPLDQLRPW